MTATSDRVLRPIPYARVGNRSTEPAAGDAASARAGWLDAFRGFTMLCLVSHGFGVPSLKGFDWAAPIARQFEHAAWHGMTAWDLVQPFFMFIVGAAMPFAFAKRLAGGKSWASGLPHVLKRCGLLLFWSHLLSANDAGKWGWDFITVLSQIAFTYFVAYLLLPLRWPLQLGAAMGLLVVHWAAFQFWPDVGSGGPWARGDNFGEHLDRLLIGRNWSGDYATFNCVSATSATVGGVLAAQLLRSSVSIVRKFGYLAAAGVALIVAGVALDMAGVVPINKRIWTASFALVSVGITLLALLPFVAVSLTWERVPWGVLIAFGANCIFLYLASRLFGGHLRRIGQKVLDEPLKWAAGTSQLDHPDRWVAFAVNAAVLGLLAYVACWLHRRRIYFKL
jgi:predicted acyltransferase